MTSQSQRDVLRQLEEFRILRVGRLDEEIYRQHLECGLRTSLSWSGNNLVPFWRAGGGGGGKDRSDRRWMDGRMDGWRPLQIPTWTQTLTRSETSGWRRKASFTRLGSSRYPSRRTNLILKNLILTIISKVPEKCLSLTKNFLCVLTLRIKNYFVNSES